MVSIISAISLLDIILTTAGMTSHPVTLHTDSETSITTSINPRLNTLHYVISNDIDVALQLQHVCKNNKQVIKLSHIHGHQDKKTAFRDLPVPFQLNVLMDRLSKKLVDDTFNLPNRIFPLPAQRLYLSKMEPIVHDVANTLVIGEMTKEIDSYYDKHHGILRNKQKRWIGWRWNKALHPNTKYPIGRPCIIFETQSRVTNSVLLGVWGVQGWVFLFLLSC